MVSSDAGLPEFVVELGDIATADADVVVVSANTQSRQEVGLVRRRRR